MIATAAGRSPSGLEKAYAAEVASKKNLHKQKSVGRSKVGNEKAYNARKTKALVQAPGGCFKALVPKASNRASTTMTVVQPW